MTITRSGYNNWSGPVTIASDATATVNVALSPMAVPQPVNLALNRTFTASRSDSNHPPARAGDGNLQTFWWSNRTGGATTTERLSVDLGSSRSIRTVEVAWSGNLWARSFRIQTSTDGTNWTTVFSTTTGTSAMQRITFSARNARHVRIECQATGTGAANGYGIAEFRVFQ
ncbi:MAG: discoidin domain-containing protein [Actinobacteria bacterium]|nr:discoidin domain-containing protein [Actinomycetota bacterium]